MKMNQKDYKEIARIIKDSTVNFINKATINVITHRLADYFERKDRKNKGRPISKKKFYFDDFNKKQFLKDCGVN